MSAIGAHSSPSPPLDARTSARWDLPPSKKRIIGVLNGYKQGVDCCVHRNNMYLAILFTEALVKQFIEHFM